MKESGIILHQALIFLIIMVLGYIAFSRRILRRDALGVMSALFVNLTLPALIFVSITTGATREEILSAWYILPVGFLCYALLSGIACITAKVMRLKGEEAGMYRLCATFGNMGFIGIPLATAVYGPGAMAFISVYTIVDQLLTWTYGISLISGESPASKEALKAMGKKMLNAPFAATLLAMLFVFFRIPVPAVFGEAFQSVSQASTALSFLYIGGMIALHPVRAIFRCRSVWAIVVFKMVCFPLLFQFLLSPFISNREALGIIMIAAGLPSISMAPILAQRYEKNVMFPTAAVIVTTVCSVVTYPILFYFRDLIIG